MTRIFATALALAVCLMLSSEARSGSQLGTVGQSMDAAPATPMLQIKHDKQQTEKNKACGPGKVFVKDQGCVKREKAEKQKAKEKEDKAKEKAKQTPPPPPPPPAPVVKRTCCTVGTATYKYCGDTENEAYLRAQGSMVGQAEIKPINCAPEK